MNNPEYKYFLTIAYDGTRYGGWQVQHNALSIQGTIQLVLQTILQMPIALSGSGRTDAGVHALEQTAHFTLKKWIDLDKTFASVNRLLPADIRILSLSRAPADFHARYSATSKIYHYHLHLDAIADPFKRLYAYQPHHKVDLNLLKKCAAYFVGTHDFTSFSHQAHQGSAAHDPVRELYRLEVKDEPGGVRLEFEGNGFLYKMVRNIVGTLLDVCSGKIEEGDIQKIMAAKDRRLAGKTAPPEGLFLVKVHYPQHSSSRGHYELPRF